jgi:hypothetical protein
MKELDKHIESGKKYTGKLIAVARRLIVRIIRSLEKRQAKGFRNIERIYGKIKKTRERG